MEHKKNTGTLFKNQYKTEDKHPNYKGRINVFGKMMDIALWKRTGKLGEPYLSVMISEPREKKQVEQAPAQDDLPNDFVPF